MIFNKMIVPLFIFCLVVQNVVSVKLTGGNLHIVVTQQHHDPVEHTIKINSKISEQLHMTQSSRVKITANLQFSEQQFLPELVTFRLRHSQYQNLTEPTLAKYNPQDATYTTQLDIGNPYIIKPFSSVYQLQIIVADQSLQKNVRNVVADCKVEFRKSLDAIPQSELHYKTEQPVQTTAPAERVDPPSLFTLFIVILILAIDAIFAYGLNHLKVNVSHLPKSSIGFLLNIAFLVVLMANLAVLLKFWINWTFLDTLQCLLVLILPTALIANYALVHVKKN